MLRQQGVKLRRAQSQQPLDTQPHSRTHSALTETHNDMKRWVLGDIHRDIHTIQHAAVSRNTQGCQTQGHRQIPRDQAHTR